MIEPAGEPTPDQRAAIVTEGVRRHMALVDGDVVGAYLGAAVSQIAVDSGLTPRGVVEKMLAEDVFLDGERWAAQKRNLEAMTRLTRARYAAVSIAFASRPGDLN